MNQMTAERLDRIVRCKEHIAEAVRWLDQAADCADFDAYDSEKAATFSMLMTEALVAIRKAEKI